VCAVSLQAGGGGGTAERWEGAQEKFFFRLFAPEFVPTHFQFASGASEAFDTVRHETFLEKMANLDLPDHVFHWLVNFFSEQQQCIAYQDTMSLLQAISASIVQGSAIGPASYVVHAPDLKAVTAGNVLC